MTTSKPFPIRRSQADPITWQTWYGRRISPTMVLVQRSVNRYLIEDHGGDDLEVMLEPGLDTVLWLRGSLDDLMPVVAALSTLD